MSTNSVVLVVEDEPLQRKQMEEMLCAAGYGVLAARSAEQALDLLKKRNDIGVVITDIVLPGEFDGMVVAWHAVRNHPVIVVSGHMRPARSDIPMLPCRWLSKPFARATLIAEVHQAAARAEALAAFGRRHLRKGRRPRLHS